MVQLPSRLVTMWLPGIRTGEIGLIKLRRWERYKGGVRVEFLCGWRALRDYRWKSALVSDLAASFTVKDREVAEAVGRVTGQLKERERAIADLQDRLLSGEARGYLDGAQGAPKIIADVLDRPPDEAGMLAGKIVSAESAVAGAILFMTTILTCLEAGDCPPVARIENGGR